MLHRNTREEMDPLEAVPCPHMVVPLSQMADGTARGLIRWLAEQHVAHCPQCSASLTGLQSLRDRLRELGVPQVRPAVESAPSLSAGRRAAMKDAWARLEAERVAAAATQEGNPA